jgi:hypothetical protein
MTRAFQLALGKFLLTLGCTQKTRLRSPAKIHDMPSHADRGIALMHIVVELESIKQRLKVEIFLFFF